MREILNILTFYTAKMREGIFPFHLTAKTRAKTTKTQFRKSSHLSRNRNQVFAAYLYEIKH